MSGYEPPPAPLSPGAAHNDAFRPDPERRPLVEKVNAHRAARGVTPLLAQDLAPDSERQRLLLVYQNSDDREERARAWRELQAMDRPEETPARRRPPARPRGDFRALAAGAERGEPW